MLMQILREALGNLLAAKQRTALSLIGMVIGTASVIAMINVGEMVRQQALEQFRAMGPDLVRIDIQAAQGGGGLRFDRASEVIGRIPGMTSATAYVSASGQGSRNGSSAYAQIIGVEGAMAGIGRIRMAEGRFVSDLDGSEPFIVAGAEAMTRGDTGMMLPPLHPGDSVRIGETIYSVIGTIEPMPFNPLLSIDYNSSLFVPVGTTRRISNQTDVSAIVGRMAPGMDAQQIRAQASEALSLVAPRAMVRVSTAEETVAAMQQQMRLFTLLLGAIGSISLVVGGVGVMNIMLVSVSERRREIGLRLAIGARRIDITLLFLIEAVVLSIIGGIIGLAAGLGASYGFGSFTSIPFLLSGAAAILGVIVPIMVGVFFGYYPATRAARLNPIDALRAE